MRKFKVKGAKSLITSLVSSWYLWVLMTMFIWFITYLYDNSILTVANTGLTLTLALQLNIIMWVFLYIIKEVL